jgi:hypothetical protein
MNDHIRDAIRAAFEAEQESSPPPSDLRSRIVRRPYEEAAHTSGGWRLLAAVTSLVLTVLVVSALLVTHLLAGTQSASPAPTAPPAPITSPSPSPSVTPTPSPLPSPTASGGPVPLCQMTDLGVRYGQAVGPPGTSGAEIILTNASNHTCYLDGYPGIQFLDASGHPLYPVPRRGGGPAFQVHPPQRIDLPRMGEAYFRIGSVAADSVAGGCPIATSMEITAPNTYITRTVAAPPIPVCPQSPPYVSPLVGP